MGLGIWWMGRMERMGQMGPDGGSNRWALAWTGGSGGNREHLAYIPAAIPLGAPSVSDSISDAHPSDCMSATTSSYEKHPISASTSGYAHPADCAASPSTSSSRAMA